MCDLGITRSYLNLLVKPRFFSGLLDKNIILCILKGQMPFKMHKIIFFFQKKINKKIVYLKFSDQLPETLIFLFGLICFIFFCSNHELFSCLWNLQLGSWCERSPSWGWGQRSPGYEDTSVMETIFRIFKSFRDKTPSLLVSTVNVLNISNRFLFLFSIKCCFLTVKIHKMLYINQFDRLWFRR